ncbi:MAG: hypothetical protein ACPLSP_03540 [Fervidicoccus fontis]
MNNIRTLLILPVGVTGEIVQGIINIARDSLYGVITITTAGFEDMKRNILQSIENACKLIGIEHYHLSVEFGDTKSSAELYKLLKKLKPNRIVISGITGSRYLFPIIASVALRYWYETKVEVLLVHGIEGERWELVPLMGFFNYDLKGKQKDIFMQIYGEPIEVLRTKDMLINKYGYTRAIYKTLSKLEERGLIRHRRNRIEKTLPGKLLYSLMRESDSL